jgi:hypothetical protein
MADDRQPRFILTAVDRTSAAFASAKRNLNDLSTSAAAIGARLGPILGTVGLLSTALGAISFTNIVRGIDALNDVKDATGASIENLSALEDIGDRTGTSFDVVSTSLVKLNGVLKDVNPDSPAARAIKQIGLNAEELRRLDPAEALRRVSVALAGFADDGDKARIVQELFGRSIKDVAPFLNDLAKAGQLNATVTTEQAEAAEKFNQQLLSLEKNTKDAARGIASQFVPALNQILQAFNERGLLAALDTFGNRAFDWENSQTRKQIKVLQSDLKDLQAQASVVDLGFLDKVKALGLGGTIGLSFGGGSKELDAEIAAKTKQLADLQAKLAPAGGGRGFVNPAEATTPKPSAGSLGAVGKQSDATSLLRKNLEQRTQAIQQTLQAEQDIIRFNERYVEAIYRAGSTSLESTFKAEDELRRRNVEEIRLAGEATIAAEEAFQKALPKSRNAEERQKRDAEVTQSESRIQAARARVAAAERDAQQAEALDAVTRPAQTQQVDASVRAFEATLDALVQGSRSQARELADIALQVQEAERTLVAAGADPAAAQARAQQLGAALEAQRQFNQARDEFARITDRARTAEELLVIAHEKSGTGLLDSERQIYELRKQSLAQLDQMLAKLRALAAANPGNQDLGDELQRLEAARARLENDLDPALRRMRAGVDEAAGAFGRLGGAIVSDAKNAKQALDAFGDTIFNILNKEFVERPLEDFFRGIARQATEGGGGGVLGGAGDVVRQAFGVNAPRAEGFFGAGPLTGAGESGGIPNDILRDLGIGRTPVAAGVAGLPTATLGAASALNQLTLAAQGAAGALGAPVAGGVPPSVRGLFGAFDPDGTGIGTTQPSAQRDILRGIEASIGSEPAEAAVGEFTSALTDCLPKLDLFGGSLGSFPQLIGDALQGILGSLGNGLSGLFSGGGAAGGGLLSSITSFFFHDGGVAGHGGDARPVTAGAFATAVRYHTGGVAGMPADAAAPPPGTIAAVLQVGEEAVAPSDPRHRSNPLAQALSAGAAIARGDIFVPGGSSVVQQGRRVPGLAPDEVPAYLPLGTEILTADDPRHIDNLFATMPAVSTDGVTLAEGADVDGSPWWQSAPRYHVGGVAGKTPSTFMARAEAATAEAKQRTTETGGGEGGRHEHHYHFAEPVSRQSMGNLAVSLAREGQREVRRGTQARR